MYPYPCTNHPYVPSPLGFAGPSRPWIEVTVSGAPGSAQRVWCLLDSGADDTILDYGTAFALGIDVNLLPWVPVAWGQGGSQLRLAANTICLDFVGEHVHADVLFGMGITMPLLGRSAWLAAGNQLEVGFDPATWKHT